jgi:hypothetical protein
MRHFLLLSVVSVGCTGASPTNFTDGGDDTLLPPGTTRSYAFDDGALPPEFFSVLGDWSVADGALVQTGSFPDPDFPRIVIEDLSVEDFHLSIKCTPTTGDIDRACGLLFRAQDSDNYMLTRANALENNIRLYHVVDGNRQQFASASTTVTANEEHTLEVDAQGAHLVVSWDGEEVLTADEATFTRGAIGVWTKADSVTRFDDLVLEAR